MPGFWRSMMVLWLAAVVLGCVSPEKQIAEEEARLKKMRAHHDLGLKFLEKNEPARALAEFQEALKIEPDSPWINSDMGHAQLRLRRYEDAAKSWQRTVANRPDHHPARYNLAVLYLEFLNRPGDAIRETQILITDPTYIRPWEALDVQGVALQKLGRTDEARAAFHDALTRRAHWPAALHLGVLEQGVKNYPQAIEAYQFALKAQDPVPPPRYIAELHYRLGTVFLELKDVNSAKKHFSLAAAVSEENPWSERASRYLDAAQP